MGSLTQEQALAGMNSEVASPFGGSLPPPIAAINSPFVMAPLPDNNPKSVHGVKKAPTLSVIPSSALLVLGQVMALGAKKYGAFNWREKDVAAEVYVDAMIRHLLDWNAGVDVDPESGVSHLGHVMACAGILIDAQRLGKLVDNRPPHDPASEMMKEFQN